MWPADEYVQEYMYGLYKTMAPKQNSLLSLGSMQMSMHKLNSHTILQLWCCCHVMYKLLYPSIRVRAAPSVSVRVSVSFSFDVTPLRVLICMCPLSLINETKTNPNPNPILNSRKFLKFLKLIAKVELHI